MKKLFLGLSISVSFLCAGSSIKKFFQKTVHQEVKKLPIVYSSLYDFYFLPFRAERLVHPFDGCKYSKVVQHLIDTQCIVRDQLVDAVEVTDEQLLRVHNKYYLDSLIKNTAAVMADIVGVPFVGYLPNAYVFNRLVKPMRLATGGTIQAVPLALQHGWAINVGAGYHHAKSGNGEGFCALADIPLAALQAFDAGVERVLIVDLDAHRGNGHEAILAKDDRVFIFDMYNGWAYPGSKRADEKIDFNYPIYYRILDKDYLDVLKTKLPEAIEQCKPELIIYNAGTDIFEKDSLGGMGVTKKGIIERDRFVFEQAQRHNIPIVMVLSGGYTSESAGIIGESIENLFNRGMLKVSSDQE